VKTLEEITYEAGRDALADQESLVAGVRQRTGTLLAAQALVASLLGGATIKAYGFGLRVWLVRSASSWSARRSCGSSLCVYAESRMAPKPLPPDQITPLPTSVGIEERRGGSKPGPPKRQRHPPPPAQR
jgi:hypothetical protein